MRLGDGVLEVLYRWFEGDARFVSTMYSNVLIAPIHILAHIFMSSETSFHCGGVNRGRQSLQPQADRLWSQTVLYEPRRLPLPLCKAAIALNYIREC